MATAFLLLFPVSVLSSLFHSRDECPGDVLEWNKDKLRLNCFDPDFIYHCLLDERRKLGEICIKGPAVRVQKGYCPQYNSLASAINTIPCPAPKGCPSHSFASNEVYIYPACLQNGDKKTANFTSNEQQLAGTRSVLVIILPILLITLLLIIFGIICLWKRRKSEAKKSGEAECEEKLPLLQKHELAIEIQKIENYLNEGAFVNTKKYEEAISVLKTKGWVTLIGPPGSGKTLTAITLGRLQLSEVSALGNRSIPFCKNIHDIPEFVDEKEEPCMIMDNLMEQYINHPSKLLQDISTFNDVFEKYIRKGLVYVIITIGKETWEELKDFLRSNIELFKSGIVEGIGEELNEDEKESMIAHHLWINKNIEETSTVKNIVININVDSLFSLPISIDLLCANRTLRGELKDSKPDKFKYKMEYYLKNWRDSAEEDDKKSFCFVFLVALCGGILSMDNFESDSKKHIYINVCKAFKVQPYARKEIEGMLSIEGNRCVPGFLYLMSKTSNTYGFHHESLLDFFLAYLCKDEQQSLFIENADITYILRKCKLSNYYYESYLSYLRKIFKYWHLEDRIEIQDKHMGMLQDRIIREIKQGTITPDWEDHVFMEHVSFKREWLRKK